MSHDRYDASPLRDAVTLVTGASSGIGRACALAFAAAGAPVVVAARRLDRLQELGREIEAAGGRYHAMELDVRDRLSVERALGALPAPWSDVRLLVNNAGLASGLDPLHEGSVDDWEKMIDTNVKGLLWVTRALVPGMVARGAGHVINIGSVAGHETYPRGAVYCASKAAVDRITRGLRLDLVDTPIRVSTVDPGLVDTEFSQVRFHGDVERADAVYQGMTPLSGRDVADAVLWVATRPAHVQVAEMLLFPTDQASATSVRRRSE